MHVINELWLEHLLCDGCPDISIIASILDTNERVDYGRQTDDGFKYIRL